MTKGFCVGWADAYVRSSVCDHSRQRRTQLSPWTVGRSRGVHGILIDGTAPPPLSPTPPLHPPTLEGIGDACFSNFLLILKGLMLNISAFVVAAVQSPSRV